jgi:ADP-ribose pyrophosphatase YjhB (NUDIX family)
MYLLPELMSEVYSVRMQPPKPEAIKHHFAGAFLVTNTGKVVGQRRDDIPTIDNPGKAAFGGTVETGEKPLNAVWRELVQEETNLKVDVEDIRHLLDDVAWRELTKEWEVRHFFYVEVNDEELENLEVYEGQGWAYINSPSDPMLIESWREPVRLLFETLKLS